LQSLEQVNVVVVVGTVVVVVEVVVVSGIVVVVVGIVVVVVSVVEVVVVVVGIVVVVVVGGQSGISLTFPVSVHLSVFIWNWQDSGEQ
jgi:hypothetical protein